MVGPAFIAYAILVGLLAYYALACEKEDRISAIVLTLALLAVTIRMLQYPLDFSLAITVPFAYFLIQS